MKALTLTQPWASMVADGLKQFETRSWGTRYRGPLAIHAAKGFPRLARAFAQTSRYVPRPYRFPCGAVVATCHLVGCRESSGAAPNDQEAALGDWSVGRWIWELADIKKLEEPIATRGSLGLWEWIAPAKERTDG
jgi:activating signal cointegrator 1